MIKNTIPLMIVFLITKILNAERYDPFYLESDRDIISKLAWLTYQGEPLFYYDIAKESDVEGLILIARRLKVKMEINFSGMEWRSLDKKNALRLALLTTMKDMTRKARDKKILKLIEKALFLPHKSWLKLVRVLKDEQINFDWILISPADIKKTHSDNVYSIKGRIGVYYLTEAQKTELRALKRACKIMINLTATKKPYRDLIPAREVLAEVRDPVVKRCSLVHSKSKILSSWRLWQG